VAGPDFPGVICSEHVGLAIFRSYLYNHHHRDWGAAGRNRSAWDIWSEGWRIMFMGGAIPAIVVGIIAWFYLSDRPAQAKWLTDEEKKVLTDKLELESKGKDILHHASIRTVLFNGRVWALALIYFGFVYGLYALAFFLPTIIAGFEAQYGTKFNVYQKGLITAIPYLPAAIVLYLWSRDATKRGVKTWHIAIPAVWRNKPLALTWVRQRRPRLP
jgi:MFS family permease